MAIIRFADTKTMKAKEYSIYFNFNQFKKFQKMEKYIDKVSFLLKFIDINDLQKVVNIDYKELDNFNENAWIKDFNQYNKHFLQTFGNKSNNNSVDKQKTNDEFVGLGKNSIIQIEINSPISLVRTLNENGVITTEQIIMNKTFQDKAVSIKKDKVLDMSKIFYNNYQEEQNKEKE